MKKLKDEQIIAALIAGEGVRGAAKIVGCCEATIRARLHDIDFIRLFDQAKNGILQTAAAGLTGRISAATDVLAELMLDENIVPSVRISAADAILRHSLRMITAADFSRRLAALEAAQEAK